MRVVVLENELLRLSILVDKGTDIFEFLYKPQDVDFMFLSAAGLRNPNYGAVTSAHSTGTFLDYYEGGWQEIFPSSGGPSDHLGAEFGMHGEVMLLPWRHMVLVDRPELVQVKFWVRTYRTPWLLEKTLTLETQSPVVTIKEKLTNESRVQLPYMWGHHPVLGQAFLDESCIVDIPARRGVVFPASADGVLLPDQSFDWPLAPAKDGSYVDMSRMVPQDAPPQEDVVYVTSLDAGWWAVTSQRRHLGIGQVWPLEVFPTVVVWRVCHGSPHFPWYGRHYSLGVEPYTGVEDGLGEAVAAGSAPILEGGDCLEFEWRTVVFSGLDAVLKIRPDGRVIGR